MSNINSNSLNITGIKTRNRTNAVAGPTGTRPRSNSSNSITNQLRKTSKASNIGRNSIVSNTSSSASNLRRNSTASNTSSSASNTSSSASNNVSNTELNNTYANLFNGKSNNNTRKNATNNYTESKKENTGTAKKKQLLTKYKNISKLSKHKTKGKYPQANLYINTIEQIKKQRNANLSKQRKLAKPEIENRARKVSAVNPFVAGIMEKVTELINSTNDLIKSIKDSNIKTGFFIKNKIANVYPDKITDRLNTFKTGYKIYMQDNDLEKFNKYLMEFKIKLDKYKNEVAKSNTDSYNVGVVISKFNICIDKINEILAINVA